MVQAKYKVRLERLREERLRARARSPTIQVFTRLTPATLEQIEAERRLYAFAPARSEVLRELVIEALAFRHAHRSPPKPRREPFPGL
jgi:hypothetical protein